MAEKLADAGGGVAQVDVEEDDDREEIEPLRSSRGRPDPFGDAFKAAEKEAGEQAEKKPAPKKAAPKAPDRKSSDSSDRPVTRTEKPEPKNAARQESADDDAGDEDDGDDEGGAEKAEPEPRKAKPYWPKERREAFAYQPRQVQEAWLAEEPVPAAHWPEEQKAAFTKMPREAKELFLERHQEIERGFSQKFEALAGERKLAEGIRQAVPPNIRAQMESLKLDEIGAFTGLLQLQQKSKQDPYGYVRDFVVRNRMDLRRLIGSIAGNAEQEDGGMQADIESHPVVRHLMAEVETLKGTVSGDLRKREQQDSDRLEGEMSTALAEKGEDGNSRYPFIRVLADTMAQIVDRNPERFDAMGTQEVVAEAYKLALEAYPELKQTQRTARASRLDEDDEDDADSAEDEASARLQQAATKKSKTPLSVPGTPGDPFSRAFSKAEKQLAR